LNNISSPCVRNCCLNEDDICLGCFRSLGEIIKWGASTEQEKEDILDLTITRKRKHHLKYGSFKDFDSRD